MRRVCVQELESSKSSGGGGENVFTMVRRIGQAKAGLAADYAAQLARSVGKVVFFAKHIDVMDEAEELFAKRGIQYASIRGEQTTARRQKNIDAFVNDPDVSIAVCSLMAAGVGLNLQVASNVVLGAEKLHGPVLDGEGKPLSGVVWKCTLSVGMASAHKFGHDATRLLKAADEALYAAKKKGRNTVCSAA